MQVFYKKNCSKKFRNIHEKTIVSLFNKVAGQRSATLLKRDSHTGVFLWILQNFQEHLFHRAPPDDCLIGIFSSWWVKFGYFHCLSKNGNNFLIKEAIASFYVLENNRSLLECNRVVYDLIARYSFVKT